MMEISNIKNSKFNTGLICLVSFWFLIFGFLSGCEKKVKEAVKAVPVSAAKVEKGTLREILFYVGDIKAEEEVDVYPKVTGKVIEELAKEGDSIKKGDILVYIDRDEVGFEFQKAPVESPIDGVVGRVYVDIGTSVSPQTPVGLVVNMDAVKVKLDVVERDLPKIKVGQLAKVQVDAYPDEVFEGRVEWVSPVVDLASRTAPVEIRIPNSNHRLKSGMFARIKILTREHKDILIIPRDAIIKEGNINYVFVSDSDNRVHRRRIETGLTEDNKFQVISGLKEGELVVTMGNIRLKDGDIVEIVERE